MMEHKEEHHGTPYMPETCVHGGLIRGIVKHEPENDGHESDQEGNIKIEPLDVKEEHHNVNIMDTHTAKYIVKCNPQNDRSEFD